MIGNLPAGVQSVMSDNDNNTIRVIGAEWCHDTVRTKKQLDALKIPYDYIDIEDDLAAEAWITQANNGKRKTPTVDMGDGKILIEPSNAEMEDALREKGLLPE
jgi:mycoredoxin